MTKETNIQKIEYNIFFSGQSDKREYSDFIRKCIKKAVEQLENKYNIKINTLEGCGLESGSPDIVDSIRANINNCDIYVADLSAVCKAEHKGKEIHFPNSNVVYELGFADRVLPPNFMLLLSANENSDLDNLPFDYAQRRVTKFDHTKHKHEDIANYIMMAFENARKADKNDFDKSVSSHDSSVLKRLFDIIDEDTYKDILWTLRSGYIIHRSQLDKLHMIADFLNSTENQLLIPELKSKTYKWIVALNKLFGFVGNWFYPISSNNDTDDYILSWIDKSRDDEMDPRFVRKREIVEFGMSNLIPRLNFLYDEWRIAIKRTLYI